MLRLTARKLLKNCATFKVFNNCRTLCALPSHCLLPVDDIGNRSNMKRCLLDKPNNLYIPRRLKSFREKEKERTKKMQQELQKQIEEQESDDDNDEDEDERLEGNIKIYKVSSLRIDSVATKAMGMGRSKVQDAFYEGKLRLNERKVTKKAGDVKAGDLIDIVRSPVADKPDYYKITRIEILSWRLIQDGYEVKVLRMKPFEHKYQDDLNI